MKIKTSNKVKGYETKFSKEKEVKEVNLTLNEEIELFITEHQYGDKLEQSHITIITKNGAYDMNYDTFINKISK